MAVGGDRDQQASIAHEHHDPDGPEPGTNTPADLGQDHRIVVSGLAQVQDVECRVVRAGDTLVCLAGSEQDERVQASAGHVLPDGVVDPG